MGNERSRRPKLKYQLMKSLLHLRRGPPVVYLMPVMGTRMPRHC